MASLRFGPTLLAAACLIGCTVDALAATGIDCATTPGVDAARITLVDYELPEKAKDILEEPSLIESTPMALTTEVDTTVLRDDAVRSDLELPTTDTDLVQERDAASLLLERRRFEIESAERDDDAAMTTKLPGMDDDEMIQFRQEMFRTDI